MKILLQRVKNSSLYINKKLFSSINEGIVVFVSFTFKDDEKIVDKMVSKLLKLRIYPDENGKTNVSIKDKNCEILSVSQFTLYASLKSGNRPSFIDSLEYNEANRLYNYFNEKIKDEGFILKEGIFGEDMQVELINDGPFTLMLDSKELF